MTNPDIDDETRRHLLQVVGAALATGAVGSAAAHPDDDGTGAPNEGHDHTDPSLHETIGDITQVGYHSLGGKGQDEADTPHYGGLTELRVENGLAFVGFISSRGPTPNRGFAIIDVSDFTRARNGADLDFAEMEVRGFARDDNDASAAMDIKLTDDAEYAVVSREPISTLFDEPNTNKNAEGEGTSVGAHSLQLWDVSDPSEPLLVSEDHTWGLGPHNAYVHNIGGTDYVFAVGILFNFNGLHVFEIDRSTDQLRFVNKYDRSGQAWNGGSSRGAAGPPTDAHDVTVVDDPVTDRPFVYFGMWSEPGMQVLDASDPTNLREIGFFEMNRAHYVQPAPTLVHGKRVAIAGQETISVDEGSSGRLFLVDCDRLDVANATNPKIGHDNDERNQPDTGDYLDKWEWQDPISFGEDFSYYLGPHNADITRQGWVHLAHYHGGVMFFEITDDHHFDERGSFKPTEPVPEASKMGKPPGLSPLGKFQPFSWGAVEVNGLTFISDINQGAFIAHHGDLEVGSDPLVDIDAAHDDAASVYTAGQTIRMNVEADVEVIDADAVWVRTRVPGEWTVHEDVADGVRTKDLGFETIVEFTTAIGAAGGDDGTTTDGSGTRTFFAEAPSDSGAYTFGPVEYTTDSPSLDDGNRLWHKLVGETETNGVVGVGTELI